MKRGFLALSMMVLCLCGCENNKRKYQAQSFGKTLRINMVIEPETLDPRKAHSITDINLAKMFMEGITRISKTGKAELALAERYSVSEDKKTYRFFLKKAKWSNGFPVTAHDFIYSWQKTLSPEFPSQVAEQLYVIKNAKNVKSGNLPATMLGIKALDDRTLVVNLENPTPYFLDLLAFPCFFPINQEVDTKDPDWSKDCAKYVANGPFIPEKWKQNDMVEARRNDMYWDANHVKLGGIELIMTNPNTALEMFESGDLEWTGSPLGVIPNDAVAALEANKQIHSQPALGTFLIRTNLQHPALKSAKVRKALAMAINRQKITDHVLQGGQAAAKGLVPQVLGMDHQDYFQDGDITQARTLLAEALEAGDVSKEEINSLTLIHAGGENTLVKVHEAIQEQWREALGVHVSLQRLEPKVYFDRVRSKDFDLAAGSWIADFSDAINFLNVFKTKVCPTNNTGWENADYTAKLNTSERTGNEIQRLKLLRESEEILMNEMPVIPLYHYNMLYAKREGVKDVVLSNMGTIDLKWASIE